MRIFVLTLFASSLVAQTGGYLAPKLPDHIKLEPAKPPEPPAQQEKKQTAPAATVRVLPGNTRCAHIIVYKPPKVDEKMIISGNGSTEVRSKMPQMQPMDVCPEDVRDLGNTRR